MNTFHNALKRYLGIVWFIVGPSAALFMFMQAVEKVSLLPEGIARTNTMLQWFTILTIFTPICVGLMIFGYYAWKGDYDHLPESSTEIGD